MADSRHPFDPFGSVFRPTRQTLADILPPFDGARPAEDSATVELTRVTTVAPTVEPDDESKASVTEVVEAAASSDGESHDVEIGWVRGILPSPFEDDHYIVQFLGGDEFRIIAYVDGFGRAFATDQAIVAPPAREPDLAMQHFGEVDDDENEDGCIIVKGESGERRRVASYTKRNGAYSIFDSWYDFSSHDDHLSYIEIMTRAYVACVYRPTLTGIPVPSSGLATIHELLGASNAVRGLRAVVLLVKRAESDRALKPPALAQLLYRWLDQAGFTLRSSHGWLWSMEDESDVGPLRLIRTRRYANMYYLSLEDESADISTAKIWAVEAALNRFLLIEETLKDKAASASLETCLATDELIRDIIAVQAPHVDQDDEGESDDDQEATPGTGEPSEWALRLAVARALEEVRVPFRFEAMFHSDLTAPGIAAFLLTTPDAGLMASERYESETDRIEVLSEADRESDALAYACNLAVIMAAVAFDACESLQRVVVSAQPYDDELAPLLFQLDFSRKAFTRWQTGGSGLVMDGEAFVAEFSSETLKEPFEVIGTRPVATYRREAPEIGGALLRPGNRERLGARTARELRINYDANLRFVANRLAKALGGASSIQDAIHMVREEQNATGNAYVYEGCTNIMRALTQGSVEPGDKAQIVATFIGRDAMGDALAQARSFMTIDTTKAADLIADAIAQAESSGRYTDTGESVHRMFDSYVSRVIYNLHNSDGRTVELIPTSLVMAYLDAINLLDQSFTKSEQAVAYGRRCIELAPTFTLAYRRCARAHMLVGDLDEASTLLTRCLGMATLPEEIAMAYYQLAYVKWKGGAAREGLACYCKSIMTSPIYAAQASMELRELMREEGIEFVPGDDIDGVLTAADIPLAPTAELLDELGAAVEAAVEENLFAVARSLLLVYLRHRPDDALADVLRSLDDPTSNETL